MALRTFSKILTSAREGYHPLPAQNPNAPPAGPLVLYFFANPS